MIKRAIMALVAVAAVGGSAGVADAGCLGGAVVGGVGGHFVHHPVLGAVGGCIVGHHMAVVRRRRLRQGYYHH